MLAEIRKDAFNHKNWLFEKKYDGYRALAAIDGRTNVELYSRNFISYNEVFSKIIDDLKKISHICLLDGEVVVEDEQGNSSFQQLQNYQRTGKGVLKYYVFDILNLNGIDVTGLPLIERKELLQLLLAKNEMKHVVFSQYVTEKGIDFYKLAYKLNLEGIIAKDKLSPYRVGRRSSEWLKIKIHRQQEAIIVGITQPKGSRSHFGSILLGAYQKGKLVYIGNCGTGFSEKLLHELYDKFKPEFINSSPFNSKIRMAEKVQWLKLKFICEIKFSEWTNEGRMRHPVFLGLRNDKDLLEVVKEIPKM
jgi:bifunctional non-homologous end joining protein LigD